MERGQGCQEIESDLRPCYNDVLFLNLGAGWETKQFGLELPSIEKCVLSYCKMGPGAF